MAGPTNPTSNPFIIGQQPVGALKRLMEILSLRRKPWSLEKYRSIDELRAEPFTNAELEAVLAEMPESDQGEALAHAAFYGDLYIGKRLLELHGPIATSMEQGSSQTLLNGRPFYSDQVKPFLRNATSAGEIAELLDWLPSAGLGWMVGIDSDRSELLNYGGLEKACQFARKTCFGGELPTFSNGKITNPELLLALYEQMNRSAYPAIYDKILCWVPEHTVAQFPDDLVPFESHQRVQVEDTDKDLRPDRTRWVPLSECSKELFNSLENEWAAKTDPSRLYKSMRYSDLELKTASTKSAIDPEADMLLGHLANKSIRHGFWEHPGMVLCQSTATFLSQFEMGGCQPDNQQRTKAFIENYGPVDLIALNHADPSKLSAELFNLKVGYKRGREAGQYAVNNLLSRLNAPEPLRSQVKGALPKELITFLAELYGDGRLNAASLGTLYREYGIDNAGMALKLYSEDIEKLHEEGYQFSKHTKVLATDTVDGVADRQGQLVLNHIGMEQWSQERYEGMFQKAISMGIWPTSKVAQPKTLSDSLVSLAKRRPPANWVQNPALASLRGCLRNAGPEQCAQAAKSDKQWLVLGEVFGTDVLQPWMPATSLKARGKLFMKDLGL